MFLKRKIKGSSIAEVVVALAVIAICFTIASLIFIRTTNTTSKFMDVKKQTELQSELMEKLQNGKAETVDETELELTIEKSDNEFSDSIQTITFSSDDERLIWTINTPKE